MKKDLFSGRVAVVTGASAGLGRELALQLAAQEARVVLAARNRFRLDEVARECRSRGGEAMVVPTDVGDKAACRHLIEQTVAEYGGVDLLINNAGYGLTADLLDIEDIGLLERLMQVNFNGSLYCTFYALPHIVKSKGSIVGISSVAGYFSAPGSSAYNASKFAMRGFFDALRMELAATGASVTMIYPGYIVTEFAARVQDRYGKERGNKALGTYRKSMMSAEKCAHITLRAAAKRKREVLIPLYAKLGRWFRLLFPRLYDRLIRKYRSVRDERFERLFK